MFPQLQIDMNNDYEHLLKIDKNKKRKYKTHKIKNCWIKNNIRNIIDEKYMKTNTIKQQNKKKIVIKNYMKDHRIFMTSVIAALSFGGHWHIHDKDSINTSFPSFIKIINKLTK